MPYTADISRANPACFLFLIDQSGSMEQALSGQPGFRKMDQAAIALNGLSRNRAPVCWKLITSSSKTVTAHQRMLPPIGSPYAAILTLS